MIATRNTRERSNRLENICWRIWHLARKKKQVCVPLVIQLFHICILLKAYALKIQKKVSFQFLLNRILFHILISFHRLSGMMGFVFPNGELNVNKAAMMRKRIFFLSFLKERRKRMTLSRLLSHPEITCPVSALKCKFGQKMINQVETFTLS